ncbi:MAG: sodium-dependent bicarbonate transport family permease [Acidimicrobiales bacterium]
MSEVLDLARTNLTTVPVLAFVLGVIAARLHSDLRLPPPITSFLSAYLLLAIGLKGGVALTHTSPGEIWLPAVATLVVAVTVPVAVYVILHRLGRFGVADAAAIAAHYGSVSAVTFTAAGAFVAAAGATADAFLPALVAILEVPGIAVALLLAHHFGRSDANLREALHEVVTGKSVMLLGGGLVIGAIAGSAGTAPVEPFFIGLFPGLLALFLLDLGILAGEHMAAIRKAGRFLITFALSAPLVLGVLGAAVGALAGLSTGGATVFAAMVASASYIAAPAAVHVALPEANPGLYLTAALALTFPLNLTIGIPLYYQAAQIFT